MYIYCLFVVFFFFFLPVKDAKMRNLRSSPYCAEVLTLLDSYLERKITEIRLWEALTPCFYLFCFSIKSLSECMRV